MLHGGPIPLNFAMDNIPTKNSIFHGYRPEDSLEMHEAYSSTETYSFSINPTIRNAYTIIRKKMPKRDGRSFIGMKAELIDENLIFDSKFESGNLDKVTKIKDDEYDLYIRTDTNTYGKNQWYYFKVTNNGPEKEFKFNIVNFSKQSSLYSQGLQPCVYRESMPSKGWHYIGENIKYRLSKVNKTILNKRVYYSLSFTFLFPTNESFRFAYSIPYTYTDLFKFLSELHNFFFIKKEVLCKSLSGVDVPILTITDSEPIEKKEFIIVTARVHPGETNGS